MSRTWKLVLVGGLCALVLGVVPVASRAGDDGKDGGKPAMMAAEKASVEIGKPAPGFTLKDVDGKEFKLSDAKGKIVVLEWTNPGCPFVVKHMEAKTTAGLMEKYKEKGVEFVSVNSTNKDHDDFLEPDAYKKTIEESGLTARALYDTDGAIGQLYGAKTTPHLFVVDKEGNLAYMGAYDSNPSPKASKETPDNYVDHALAALTSGKAVEKTSTKPYGCGVKYAK